MFIDISFKEVSKEFILSKLCYREDDEFYWFKKVVNKNLKSPYEYFQYELNKWYDFDVDTVEDKLCGKGFNVATEEWLKEEYNEEVHLIYLAKIPKEDNVIVLPYDMQKVRCKKAFLTDEQ